MVDYNSNNLIFSTSYTNFDKQQAQLSTYTKMKYMDFNIIITRNTTKKAKTFKLKE